MAPVCYRNSCVEIQSQMWLLSCAYVYFLIQNTCIMVLSLERHLKLQNRIVGGQEVWLHSAPCMAFVQASFNNNIENFCGGTLISEKYILTAAHCVKGARSAKIYLGKHELGTYEYTQEIIESSEIIVHEGYDHKLPQHDIALISLPQDVTESTYIKPCQLPVHEDVNNTYDYQTGTTYGWGLTQDIPGFRSSDMSKVLMSVDVDVLPLPECRKKLSEIYDYKTPIFNTNLCTSGDGIKGTCVGDSGGPLLMGDTVVGITAHGPALCATGAPSVYTKVASYLQWIENNSDISIDQSNSWYQWFN